MARLVVPGVADVAIASVHADVLCQGPPNCNRPRFVTGGGWIKSGTSRANFAVAAREGPSSWGHMLYKDKATGKTYKGTPAATTFSDNTTAHITGYLDDGVTPFVADVTDNGEPGTADTFSLAVGVPATLVNAGTLQGGNIQVHLPCK